MNTATSLVVAHDISFFSLIKNSRLLLLRFKLVMLLDAVMTLHCRVADRMWTAKSRSSGLRELICEQRWYCDRGQVLGWYW